MVPVVTSLMAAVAVVTAALITVLVKGTPGVSDPRSEPATTVVVTQPAAAGSDSPTSSASPSAGQAKWLTDLDQQRHADQLVDVMPGIASVEGKKFNHTFTVDSQCDEDTQGVFFPTEVGHSHVDVQVGWRTTDSNRHNLTAYLARTDGDASDSVHISWTEADEVVVGRSGLATLSGDVPAHATAFKLYTQAKDTCGSSPVSVEGRYS